MAMTRERRREYNREWVSDRRAAWIDAQGGACVKCGAVDGLEIDHIDPASKQFNPTQLWTRSKEVRDAELAKCQVLCTPCHQQKTYALVDRSHGTPYRYQEAKCRCEACRGWNAARMRRQRAAGR